MHLNAASHKDHSDGARLSAVDRAAVLISPNFPPANKISSLRPYYLATALRDAGFRVFVLASEARDQGLPRCIDGVLVKYVPGSGLRWWLRAIFHLGRIAIRERKVDWIISSYGPSSAHVLGAMAKIFWPTSRWIADYRDIWTTGSYYGPQSQPGWKSKIKRTLERALLLPSWAVVSISPTLLRRIASFHRKPGIVLYNGFERASSFSEAGDTEERRTEQLIQICYTGTIYAERSPLPFVEAVRQALESINPASRPRVEIVMAGMIDDSTMAAISPYIRAGLVRHLGVVSRQRSYDLQRGADFCLLIEDVLATSQGVLTGKLFEYLGQSKPIIALGVERGSDMERILTETGLGAYVGVAGEALSKFLVSIFSLERAPTVPDEGKIAHYERQSLSAQFVDCLLSGKDL